MRQHPLKHSPYFLVRVFVLVVITHDDITGGFSHRRKIWLLNNLKNTFQNKQKFKLLHLIRKYILLSR